MENIQYSTQKETCEFCQKQLKPKNLNRHYNSKKCKEIQRDNFFEECCLMGELEKVKFIFENNRCEMICSDFINGFLSACCGGHFNIIEYLWENDDNVILLEHMNHFFFEVLKKNRLNIAKWIWKNSDNVINPIKLDFYFKLACESGRVDFVYWINSINPQRYKIGKTTVDSNGCRFEPIINVFYNLEEIVNQDCIICYENKTCYQVNCCKKTVCHKCLSQINTNKCAHCRQYIH